MESGFNMDLISSSDAKIYREKKNKWSDKPLKAEIEKEEAIKKNIEIAEHKAPFTFYEYKKEEMVNDRRSFTERLKDELKLIKKQK